VTPRASALDLEDAVTLAASRMPGGERVQVSVPAGLPPAQADPGLFDRVLANVLENALRHSPGRVPVSVQATATASEVELRVVDRGPGVPSGAHELIFAPFQRYGDAPRGTGIGLGLAVARGLMEAMDGTVAADDTPGGGLTITLRLPRARSAEPAPEVATAGGATDADRMAG